MKIKRIEVKNYRLLKNFSLDLEDELSLVIGKNNCGKTSLLTVLDKFLNNNIFTENDFNLDYKKEIFCTHLDTGHLSLIFGTNLIFAGIKSGSGDIITFDKPL